MGVTIGSGILGLIWLIIVLWAVLKVAASSAGMFAKVLWILILLLFRVVGLFFWLLLGPQGCLQSFADRARNARLNRLDWRSEIPRTDMNVTPKHLLDPG